MRFHDLPGLLNGSGQRLFAQHVFSSSCRRNCIRGVLSRWSSDVNGSYVWIRQAFFILVAAIGPRVEFLAQPTCFTFVATHQANKARMSRVREGWQNRTFRDGSQSHDCITDFLDRWHGMPNLTLPICPAELLISDCFVVQAAQFLNIRQHFVNRVGDRVDIAGIAEEQLMGEPNCFLVRRTF